MTVEQMMEKIEEIQSDRNELYGDHTEGHAVLGELWLSLLSTYQDGQFNKIPPWVVEVMMCAHKLVRIIKSPQHDDNYLDAINYLLLAKESYDREQKEG